MKCILSLLVYLLIFSPTFACNVSSDKLALANYQWLTEDYPPYNFANESGHAIGIFSDVLMLVYQELGIKYNRENITFTPWARLYHAIQNEQLSAGFSMANTPEREALFKLVPLPIVAKTSIMVLKERKKQLLKEDVNDLVIAVVREDVGQLRLKKANISAKQIETTSAVSMLKMLMHKRVDAVAYAEDVAYFQYKKLELTRGTLVPIYVLEDKSLASYAFHKSTPKCITDLFAKTINQLHQRGELSKIKNKYIQNE